MSSAGSFTISYKAHSSPLSFSARDGRDPNGLTTWRQQHLLVIVCGRWGGGGGVTGCGKGRVRLRHAEVEERNGLLFTEAIDRQPGHAQNLSTFTGRHPAIQTALP